MQISRKNVLKATLATLGAILVGAIGSGVWQELLAPGLRVTRNWILDLVSFVSRSFKDDIYAQVARDQSNMVNLETLFLVTIIYIALYIAVAMYFAGRFKDLQGRHERLVRKVQRELGEKNEPEM